MNKLLFLILLLLGPSRLYAQVVDDPNMIHKNGFPVMVPSRAPTPYNDYGNRRLERPRPEIPGTLRKTETTPLYPGWEDSGFNYDGTQRYDVLIIPDTTRMHILDENGRPIRSSDGIFFPETDSRPDSIMTLPADMSLPADSLRQRRINQYDEVD